MFPLFKLFSRIGETLFKPTEQTTLDTIEAKIAQFSKQFPFATRQDWMMFARSLSDDAYQKGFQAGYRWNETELDRMEITPEEIADRTMPEWRDIPYDLHAPVHETYQELEHAKDSFFRHTGRELGRRL